MKSNFSDRLKKILEEKDITQAQLAKMTGITQSSISDWLRGRYAPKQDKIDLIARALNVTPTYLMGWEDTENETDETETNVPTLIAAHWEGNGDFTEEQLEEISNFIDFVKSKNKGNT